MKNARLKPKGPWEVCRKFKLPTLVHDVDARIVERSLGQTEGVRAVDVNITKQLVTVRYETTEIDHETLRETLYTAGFPPCAPQIFKQHTGAGHIRDVVHQGSGSS
jgi:copper chaperone CopZ